VNRSAWFVAILLAMLAAVVTMHLVLLQTGLAECDAYQRILIDRLKTTKIGTPEAVALRNELKEYLDGGASECAEAEGVYADAADKYIAVILALMTGATAATGVATIASRQKEGPPPTPPPEV
jgi:hypothetical protein